MMALKARDRLIDRLPRVRGEIAENAPLAPLTWFRVGGPAEVLFRPVDADDLAAFLAGKPADVAVTVIGAGSNLLVRDGGVAGVVIRLGRPFATISVRDTVVEAGAAALGVNVALATRDAALKGAEFLCGIPGTIGGALRMNAGAYQREIKDVLAEADAVDGVGRRLRITTRDFGFSYRHSEVAADVIFTAARLQLVRADAAEVARAIEAISTARRETQPVGTRTGGSTFTNPPGRKAWELIEAAGCRGLKRGGAQVSELHCNFLINTGGATAADLEGLGEEVRRRVRENSGVMLEWEIRRIGMPRP
jgi:UDP-N-acetylmuramate dehydrogenase